MWPGNEFLCALKELLFKEWAGDYIFFMGDEKDLPADTENETLKILYKHISLVTDNGGDNYDTVIETYRNVSCLFRDAEPNVRREILFYLEYLEDGIMDLPNKYGIDASKPFEWLFLRNERGFSVYC